MIDDEIDEGETSQRHFGFKAKTMKRGVASSSTCSLPKDTIVREGADPSEMIPSPSLDQSEDSSEILPMEEDDGHHLPISSHPPATQRFYHRSKVLWSQLTLSEVSGAFGDLGTFVPLFTALARQRSIYARPALFLAGFANVLTGYAFDVPMPLQPMKSIAAVAIAEVLSREQVTTAGLCMGIMLILLGCSNGIEWVNRVVPSSVVSGMQLGVGLSLAIHGLHMVADLNWMDQPDCILLALLCSIACLHLLRETPELDQEAHTTSASPSLYQKWRARLGRQPPVGLSLFLLGILLAAVKLARSHDPASASNSTLGGAPVIWALGNLTWDDWKIGFLEGAFPQLPLTTLNSVISVCCLAHSLYPEKRLGGSETDAVLSRREVSLSVGVMNLLLCPFGAMPNCHGAGGLAGQYKFGARHGAAVVFLGVNKILLAILVGGHLLPWLDAIPAAILGVMLVVSGNELACTGFTVLVQSSRVEDDSDSGKQLRTNTAVAVITAAVIIGLKKTHYGFLAGGAVYLIYGDGFAEWRGSQQPLVIRYTPVSADQQHSEETDTSRIQLV